MLGASTIQPSLTGTSEYPRVVWEIQYFRCRQQVWVLCGEEGRGRFIGFIGANPDEKHLQKYRTLAGNKAWLTGLPADEAIHNSGSHDPEDGSKLGQSDRLHGANTAPAQFQ